MAYVAGYVIESDRSGLFWKLMMSIRDVFLETSGNPLSFMAIFIIAHLKVGMLVKWVEVDRIKRWEVSGSSFNDFNE